MILERRTGLRHWQIKSEYEGDNFLLSTKLRDDTGWISLDQFKSIDEAVEVVMDLPTSYPEYADAGHVAAAFERKYWTVVLGA